MQKENIFQRYLINPISQIFLPWFLPRENTNTVIIKTENVSTCSPREAVARPQGDAKVPLTINYSGVSREEVSKMITGAISGLPTPIQNYYPSTYITGGSSSGSTQGVANALGRTSATLQTNIDNLSSSVSSILTTPSITGEASFASSLLFSQILAPTDTSNRLYNTGGNLYWAGNLIGGGSVGNWTLSGSDAYRTSGNVGIGTSSPFAKLSVVGDGYFTSSFSSANLTATGTVTFSNSSLANAILATNSLGQLISTTTLTVNNILATSTTATNYFAGNVGIGTTSPGYKLDVNGDVNVRGDLTIGTTLYMTCSGATDRTADITAKLVALNTAGGGTLILSGMCRVDGQIVLPKLSSSPWTMAPLRITGAGGESIGSADNLPSVPLGGSGLDLRYAGDRILSLGQGTLELDHLTITNGGTTCGTFVRTTLTSLKLHDNSILGAQAGASACEDVWVAGGTNPTSTGLTGTIDDYFQGYGSDVSNNFADKIRRLVLGQVAFNSVTIRNNRVWTRAGSNLVGGGAIEIAGGSFLNSGNYITGNLIEMVNYACGIVLSHTQFNTLVGNSFWDAPTPTTQYQVCGDATADYNTVIAGYPGTAAFNPTWKTTNTSSDGLTGYMVGASGTQMYRFGGFSNISPGLQGNGAGINVRLADNSGYTWIQPSYINPQNAIGYYFGAGTSAYPALKRVSTGIEVRLADDSGYAPITGIVTAKGSGSIPGAVWSTGASTFQQFLTGAGTSRGLIGGTATGMAFWDATGNNSNLGTDDSGNAFARTSFGIATTSPWRTFSVNGTVAMPGLVNDSTGYYVCLNTTTGQLATSTGVCGASSIKYKENVQSLSYGLEDVLKLKPVSFDYKNSYIKNAGRQIGFIAEEVAPVIPEVVSRDSSGEIQGLDYPKFTAVLAKAIQELNKKFDDVMASITEILDKYLASHDVYVRSANIDDLSVNRNMNINSNVCVDDTCVTKEQFKQILLRSGVGATQVVSGGGNSGNNNQSNATSTDNTSTTTSETSTSTPSTQEQNTSSTTPASNNAGKNDSATSTDSTL